MDNGGSVADVLLVVVTQPCREPALEQEGGRALPQDMAFQQEEWGYLEGLLK